MALGNNLKRTKKDSLIPAKKKVIKKKVDKKPVVKSSAKAKKVLEVIPAKEKAPAVISQPRQTANLTEKLLLGGEENSPITVKLIPSRRKSVRKTKLVFSGSLTITEAAAIKDCLVSTFNDYDLIDIQLKDIIQLDLIPIQMIKVFINHFPDKKIKVDSDLPFDIKLIVERSGFGSLMFKEETA